MKRKKVENTKERKRDRENTTRRYKITKIGGDKRGQGNI